MKLIFFILIVHWLLDFVLQTDKQAKGKSTSISMLLQHTVTYSLGWFNILVLTFMLMSTKLGDLITFNLLFKMLIFMVITFVCHTITDYFTSKWNKKLWEKGDTHNFFVMVGFDQLLHYAQLFLCAFYLTKIT